MRLLYILLLGFPCLLRAQMHDNTWITGYAGNGPEYGNSFLTFSDGSLIIDSISASTYFQDNNASFSTFDGQFFAHFNGFHIRDKSFLGMSNGTYLNTVIIPGLYYLSDDDTPQGSMFLPYPGHPDSVLLLYMSDQLLDVPGAVHIVCADLSYAVIDMSGNNGLGNVVERTTAFLHDTLQYGHLQAVQHANGRDWWVPVMEGNGKYFYRILITPNGLTLVDSIAIETDIRDGLGASKFSPDGKKYIIYNGTTFAPDGSSIDVFDFDRCSGLLYHQQQFRMKGEVGGIAVSANSRYLYQALGDSVFQYDLQQPHIVDSRTLVALYDGFKDPLPVKFYQMQLAPDQKIYITATNGTQYLHVIDDPDMPAPDCHFRQHGIRLLKYYYASLPNHPNYRLGPMDGTVCDSLPINNLPHAWYRYTMDTLDAQLVSFHDLSYYEPGTWQWDFGDGSAGSSDRHPVHYFEDAGVYEVCLTVTNSYGTDTHCKTLYVGVSAADNPVVSNQVFVGPNPFSDFITITLNTYIKNAVFHLYDLTGRECLHLKAAPGMQAVTTTTLPAGMYFWQMRSGKEVIKAGKLISVLGGR